MCAVSVQIGGFLSTLSLRRATNGHETTPCRVEISIHALLAESDRAASLTPTASRNFYPRSPCGERHARRASRQQPAGISIHALLAESDCTMTTTICIVPRFLSTLSLRRATAADISARRGASISIHALLAESDWWLRCWQLAAQDISIHALLAESDHGHGFQKQVFAISIHALLAESDVYIGTNSAGFNVISIHALLAESDGRPLKTSTAPKNFYPRSPCGERPFGGLQAALSGDFYPRSPCGERRSEGTMATSMETFLSTLSLRRATLQGRNRRN